MFVNLMFLTKIVELQKLKTWARHLLILSDLTRCQELKSIYTLKCIQIYQTISSYSRTYNIQQNDDPLKLRVVVVEAYLREWRKKVIF